VDEILIRTDGPVTVLTLNRPEAANALSPTLVAALGDALDAAAADPGVAAVVLTGAGDRVFCAGLDLKGFAGGDTPGGERTGGFHRLFRERYPKPLVAAANGHVVAGGFELLLRCDLVVAAEHVEFGLPEVARGLVAGAGLSILPGRIPMPIVLELGLTAGRISAQRACDLGLVNRVVALGRAEEAGVALAHQVAVNGPLALRLTKELAYAAEDDDRERRWQRIESVTAQAIASADALEGARAFVEKRAPRWRGH